MLSILIPTYNYNIVPLVTELREQAEFCGIDFEILCNDDNSTKFVEENKLELDKYISTKYIISEKNLGRTQTRQSLSEKARYDWLLFIDADVLPKSKFYISEYLKHLNGEFKAVFGGFAYDNSINDSDKNLRFKSGKIQEEVKASKRNKNPFQLIISANFLVKKSVFIKINSKVNRNSYGMDNYFASILKTEKIKVLHIDNEVYHYGLEPNDTFLKKCEEAIKNLLWMLNEKKIKSPTSKLLKTHIFLKKIKFNYIFAYAYMVFNKTLRKNLLSDAASVKFLQIYKLLFINYIDLKKQDA